VNGALPTTAPPAIRQVDHSPNQPHSGQPVRVTAKISDPEGVRDVTLLYQVVEPGAYVELTDPEYETRWTAVPMRDDGAADDEAAGDEVYTASLPPTVQQHRRLV